MTVEILPSLAKGTVNAPASKSMAHRTLISAALAQGVSTVWNVTPSEDLLATMDCLKALGAGIDYNSQSAVITGMRLNCIPNGSVLPCRESGSTLRFLVPLALISEKEISFTGSHRLFDRPLGVYEEICRDQGLLFRHDENRLTVRGRLSSGKYSIPGNVSSQFISGLCFALPLLDGDSEIEILPPLESAPYLEMTLQILSQCGIRVYREHNRLMIPGGQRFSPLAYRVEGDWTNAAYLEALGFESGAVRIAGLDNDSIQGDRIYPEFFKSLRENAPVLDLSDCPDLGPVLFALAADQHGGVFTGIKRLRLKESDRITAMAEELRKFGAELKIDADTVTIFPASLHEPDCVLWGHGDHRIVMALSILASVRGGTIRGADAVNKSFPGYFDTLRSLGVRWRIVEET